MDAESRRVSVVTGGASGIGAATAAQLAAAGDSVVVLDLRHERAGSFAKSISCDVASADQVQAAFDAVRTELGSVTTVVNCAGANFANHPLTMTESEWDRAFAVNVKGMWLCARAAVPLMTGRGCSIVNVSSVHASRTTAGLFPYAATKSAVSGLTRSLALELAPRRIRVNSVAPGWTRTPITDQVFAAATDPEAARSAVDAVHPLGRIGEAEEIAAAIAFLASDAAAFVTGTELAVDGGLLALLPA
jgi:NAD(P)-dependent dehydrogenase (short-subunit alcohol dehydrogenase family)